MNLFEEPKGPRIMVHARDVDRSVMIRDIIYLKLTRNYLEINLIDNTKLKVDGFHPNYSILLNRKSFYRITSQIVVNLVAVRVCLRQGLLVMRGGKKINFPEESYKDIVKAWSNICGFRINKDQLMDLNTRKSICEMIMRVASALS